MEYQKNIYQDKDVRLFST